MAPFKVHKVRFYEPEPLAIHSMSLSYNEQYLALSRKDSSIEIWDVYNLPVLKTFIPPLPDVQVEQVAWFDQRLFGCGLNGFLYEFDYQQLKVKASYAVTSGPAWCLGVCKPLQQIAVGTESGIINIFQIVEDGLDFYRLLDKQEERVLCLAWHHLGVRLAGGTTDAIRVWDPKKGNIISRMKPGRLEPNTETIVWSLLMTKDYQVISGDSTGRTSFWDGELGTHIQSVITNKADIMALAFNRQGNKIYSTGVEPITFQFQQIFDLDTGKKKWARSKHTKDSDHDIRCILPMRGDDYFFGGLDSYLTFFNNDKKGKALVRFPSVPRDGVIEVAKESGIFLLKYRSHLELWRLGAVVTSAALEKDVDIPLSEGPRKLLQLDTPNEESLVCSSVNKSGNLLAYATHKRFRVFEVVINENDESVQLHKLKLDTSLDTPPTRICFYNIDKEEFILCGYGTARLECLGIVEGAVKKVGKCLQGSEELQLTSSIQHMSVAGSTAVVTDFNNQAVAVDLKTNTLISKFPVLSTACITAVALSPDAKNCVLTYSDQRLAEINVETAKFTAFCIAFHSEVESSGKSQRRWSQRWSPVSGVNYIKEDLILLNDFDNLILIDFEEECKEPAMKKHIFFEAQDKEKRKVKSIQDNKSINWDNREKNAIEMLNELFLAADDPPIIYKKISGGRRERGLHVMTCTVKGRTFQGSGKSQQEAKHACAKEAVEELFANRLDKLHFPEKDQAASSEEILVEMEGNTMGGIPCVQYQVRVHKHQDLVAVVPLATDELVCVELDPQKITSKLPDSLLTKRYGAK